MHTLLQKYRKIAMDHSPDQLFIDGDIFVSQLVPETDDLSPLINLAKELRISP